jgi:hypothetical protein
MDFNTLQVTSENIIKRRPFTVFDKFSLGVLKIHAGIRSEKNYHTWKTVYAGEK